MSLFWDFSNFVAPAMEEQSDDETKVNFKFSSSQFDSDYRIAARLVIDAKEIRNVNFRQTTRALELYELYLSKAFVIGINVVIFIHLVVLPFFEKPAYFQVVDPWVPTLIEGVCLFIYIIRWLHLKTFQTNKDFFSDKKHVVVLITIILILIDILQFNLTLKYRFTRPLRVLFYINFNEGKELRRAFRNVRKTLPDILNVYILFLISLAVFSFLGWKLFKTKNLFYPNGEPYFTRYEDSLWDMYVSVTTANFPDVMMPAYNKSGIYAIFFISFMLLNLYMFINIILATIYSNYKKHLKNEVKETIGLKRKKLISAFEIIKARAEDNGEIVEGITLDSFMKLIKLVDPQKTENQIKVIFNILNFDNSEVLSKVEFLYLADLLNVRLTEVKDRQTFFEQYIPQIYNCAVSEFIKKVVKHKFFGIPVDILIVANVVLLIIDEKNSAEWFFLSAFILEIFLKLYVYGIREFFSVYWNIFDILIISAGLVVGIIEAVSLTGTSKEFLEIILILRLLRLLKLFSNIKRFRVIITTIMNITPSLMTYATLILTVYYIFAMIGMEIFGSVITFNAKEIDSKNCSNELLNDSEFAKLNYCKNNFSTFLNALVLMFELMVVNQWHILSGGFIKVTTKWARLFFFSFHVSCVIVCLNIFTAFVIEAFLLEYETTEKSQFEIKIEAKITELGLNLNSDKEGKPKVDSNDIIDSIAQAYSNDTPTDTSKIQGLKFHINPKGPKSVEVLLQRMFSQEFDITQDEHFEN